MEHAAGLDEVAPADQASNRIGVAGGELSAERLFSASVSKTKVLKRDEETQLAEEIVRARARVRRVIRHARRLTRAALADAGRGVVTPDADFREREAITILNFAQQGLGSRRAEVVVGMKRPELRKFVSDLTQALKDYRALRDRMVEANIRLVNVLARQYHHPTLSFLDLVQEGTIGLIRAIEKYEPSRKVKFSTYAVWWIWQQITRSVDNQGALIRTPVHWSQFRRRMSRETQLVGDEGSRPREEFAADAHIDPARAALMTQAFRFVSTDAPASDDDERPLETIAADEETEPEEQALQTDLSKHLRLAITQLPEREAYIVQQRFGLRDDQSETLEEIGTRFGVSRERIRQLETRALKQLRAVCSAQGLEAYLH